MSLLVAPTASITAMYSQPYLDWVFFKFLSNFKDPNSYLKVYLEI